MAKILMITGLGSVKDLVSEKRGAFYYTLEEFSKYWDRIDIISPRVHSAQLMVNGSMNHERRTMNLFGNVYVHISPWPLIFHPFWFLKKGAEIYREQKFDLMTVQEYPPFYNGIGARLLWNKIKVPYILEIHHVPGYPRAANFKEILYRNLVKIFIEFDSLKAKAVRVVNQHQTSDFLIQYGVPKDKIVYIPSAYIDLEVFKPMNLAKEYDLVFMGRLESNKGADLFLETVVELDCKALMIGSGSLFGELKSKIKNLNLKVDMHGWAKDSSEVATLLNKSKILVMPSYNEGGPRVVLEAMACGIPVLATPVGIVPEIAGQNGCGLVNWDSQDIAEKTKILLDDDAKYRDYQIKGLELSKNFERHKTIENFAEKLKNLIK